MKNLIFVSLFFSIILTTYNRGFFSLSSFSVLILLDILLFYLFFRENLKVRSYVKRPLESFGFFFILTYTLFLFGNEGIYQTEIFPSILIKAVSLFCFPLVITYAFPLFNKSSRIRRFFFLLFTAFVLRILIIIASPKPIIDVFTILKEAPLVLVRGGNPYGNVFSTVYPGFKLDYFSYWPASFLLQIPFVLLFADPRILMVISDIASAILLFLLGKKGYFAQILALIYLFRPNSLFIIEQSWLTPLAFFLVVLALFSFERKKEYLAGVFLGFLTCLQPYFAIFFVFFSFARQCLAKLAVGFLSTIVVLVLPFLLINPNKFIDQTILFYFKKQEALATIPFHLSLNLNTFYYSLVGLDIPLLYLISAIIIIGGVIICRLFLVKKNILKNQKYFENRILLGSTLFYLNFYLFFRQSFINYYYFITGLFILWIIKLV